MVFTLLVTESCYYDHEELLYPESVNCTPLVNPSFVTDILPILNTRCNNCHAGTYASGGVKLDTYSNVMISVNNGSLLGSITYKNGFSPMPKNAGKLSACEIQKIQEWIAAGPTNN